MARKKKSSSQPACDTRSSRMYPSFHRDVVEAVSTKVPSVWFCKNNNGTDSIDNYETHIMGRFECVNSACATRGWGSKKIAIKIWRYAGNGYNADVFSQRCKACRQLGRMIVDKSSYVERVAYRVQKWAGVQLEPPPHSGKPGQPHKRDLCEGCRVGVCRQGNDWNLI